jgi:segregation and condensation protein A
MNIPKDEGRMNEPLTFRLEKVVRARSDDYEDFVGPIDLILHLISRDRIEIKDIKISELLEQYLEYLDRMKSMDLEIASEFTTMASHLLYIKTRMLLSLNSEETDEEMDILIKTLEERRLQEGYQRIQTACGYFQERQEFGRNILFRPPEPPDGLGRYTYRHPLSDLTRALTDIAERGRRKLPPPVAAFAGIVGREIYPVSQKITDILKCFVSQSIWRLKNLFKGSKSRSEVVATFLAVLELCKDRKVFVKDTGDGDYSLERGREST